MSCDPDAISTVDGRYCKELQELRGKASERALFYARIYVELKYLEALVRRGVVGGSGELSADEAIKGLKEGWYERVKALEEELGHDVKAAEVYTRGLLDELGLSSLAPYVHLGLTSDDVNSLAFGLMYLDVRDALIKRYSELASLLADLAERYARTVMLGRTHGLPAVPTTFGKELAYFSWKIYEAARGACAYAPYGKLSGAVGSYNAMKLVAPDFDWEGFARSFVASLGLRFPEVSKQTAPYEGLSDSLHYIIRANMAMAELARDLWMYSMLGLIRFERRGVGSSTMPHKVNPVDLEDAEGQARVSTQLLYALAYEIIPTRLQRDLSDSTLRRNLWQALAHSFLAAGRLIRALSQMRVDEAAMLREVSEHKEVLSEAVQVSLRAQGDRLGYEEVRENLASLERLASRVKGELGERLRALRPEDYVGLAPEISLRVSKLVKSSLSGLCKGSHG